MGRWWDARTTTAAAAVAATEVAAILYSLLESAKLCGVDPKAYLRAAALAALNGEPPLLPHQDATAT